MVPPSVERLLDDPERASRGGWAFDASQGFADPVFQAKDLREVYDRSAGGNQGERMDEKRLVPG